MEFLRINFIPILIRLFLAQSLMGIIASIIIFAVAFFVAFQLRLCSYLPEGIPFEGIICNRLLQALVIFLVIKKVFVRS